jgi:glyoxylate reductase/D-3-phosphoglycerate dehydrogenase
MEPKIVVFLNSDAQVEAARAMAPQGCERRIFTKRGEPEALAELLDADFLIGTIPPFDMDDDFYQACPKLKLVQLLLAGYDKYDVEAARRAGVTIATNGGANSAGVAEHAIMMMLALKRHLLRYHQDVVTGRWWKFGDMPFITDLNGATLGIIGFNTIGRRLGRLAHAFGMRVIYYDVARLLPHEEEKAGVAFRLMQELLRESDVVSLHVPLLPSTRHMIGAAQLALMKPSAILINTSRGPVVDEAALLDALASRRIAGAGLDVLAKEPPEPDNPLFSLDNVVLTPHQAGHIVHYFEPALRNALFNVHRVQGGELPNWVIPELRDELPNSRILASGLEGTGR